MGNPVLIWRYEGLKPIFAYIVGHGLHIKDNFTNQLAAEMYPMICALIEDLDWKDRGRLSIYAHRQEVMNPDLFSCLYHYAAFNHFPDITGIKTKDEALAVSANLRKILALHIAVSVDMPYEHQTHNDWRVDETQAVEDMRKTPKKKGDKNEGLVDTREELKEDRKAAQKRLGSDQRPLSPGGVILREHYKKVMQAAQGKIPKDVTEQVRKDVDLAMKQKFIQKNHRKTLTNTHMRKKRAPTTEM